MKPRRPTTAALDLPPLCKPRPLQAPTELLQRIEMMWRLFYTDSWRDRHYWTEQHLSRRERREPETRQNIDSASEWQHYVEELAARAGSDDEALFELIRLDPRHLATELVIAKIMLWRLQVMLGKRRSAGKSGFASRANVAQKKLRQLSQALAYVTGQGKKQWISPFELSRQYTAIREGVERASELLKGQSSMPEPPDIIRKAGLPSGCESAIRDLIAKPESIAPVTKQILADLYGIAVATLETHLVEANKLLDEPGEP